MVGMLKVMERPLTSVLRRRDTEPLRTRTKSKSDAILKGDRGYPGKKRHRLWVESSSTDDSRLRGARPIPDIAADQYIYKILSAISPILRWRDQDLVARGEWQK